MSFIGGSIVSFSLEYMPKVASAGSACYLNTGHTKRFIFMTSHGTRDGIVERWPAAAAVELGPALVQRGPASSTAVYAFFLVVVVLSRCGAFGALLTEHTELFAREDSPPFVVSLVYCSHRSKWKRSVRDSIYIREAGCCADYQR